MLLKWRRRSSVLVRLEISGQEKGSAASHWTDGSDIHPSVVGPKSWKNIKNIVYSWREAIVYTFKLKVEDLKLSYYISVKTLA